MTRIFRSSLGWAIAFVVAPLNLLVLVGGNARAASEQASKQTFFSDLDILKAIERDLQKTGQDDRRFRRYFSLTHLANASESPDQFQRYRNSLAKLLNSLSWNRRIHVPEPINSGRTILRIDLRDYLWDSKSWKSITRADPFAGRRDGATFKAVSDLIGDQTPFVRADWFLSAASRPPLYHELLNMPDTIEALERKLDVNPPQDNPHDRSVRAGFNGSKFAKNNRGVERHESIYGAYWRTFDFFSSVGRKDLLGRPLGPGRGEYEFQPDGGEALFDLPNGLLGFMIVDGQGRRIDAERTEIARDGPVLNGISCMNCHARGPIEKADQVRGTIAMNKALSPETIEAALALYPPSDRMAELIAGDIERFTLALQEVGTGTDGTDSLSALVHHFEEDLDLNRAAAESSLSVKEFREMLDRTPRLTQTLSRLLAGGLVARKTFLEAFPLIVEAREPALPPDLASNRSVVERPVAKPEMDRPAGSRPAVDQPDIDTESFETLPTSFSAKSRDGFREMAPKGGMLVGVSVSYANAFGRNKIGGLQPIFKQGSSRTDGQWHGGQYATIETVLAKDGYAVGGLRTRSGALIDGFEIVFMKIKGKKLDPSDSYISQWLGDTQGGSPKVLLSDGRIVLGIMGRAQREVNALALVVERSSNTAPAMTRLPRREAAQHQVHPAPEGMMKLPQSLFGDDRDGFVDVAPKGAVLAGVRVSYVAKFGGNKICALQPIFKKGTNQIDGEWHGGEHDTVTTALAKDGYAVGGLRTRTGLMLDGFDVVFMKINGDGLDPSDSYNSQWLGDTKGGSPKSLSSEGQIVAGIHGRAAHEINALGLILIK